MPDDLVVGWWVALAVGLGVLVVLIALLHSLHRQVKAIDAAFERVWEMGKQVAGNTATTWMLERTAHLVENLNREAAEHEALLARKGG